MLLLVEIIMFVAGVWALATGRLPPLLFGGSQYKVEGRGVRLLGVILMLPLPLAFVAGVVLSLLLGDEGTVFAIPVELALVLMLGVAALVVGRVVRKPKLEPASDGTIAEAAPDVESVIAKKAEWSLIYAVLGIFGATGVILCPLAFIRSSQALKMIDQYQVGERYRNTARAARILAVVVFLPWAAIAVCALSAVVGTLRSGSLVPTTLPPSPVPTALPALDDARACIERGYSLLEEGHYLQALNDFSAAVGLDPDNAEAYLLRGLAHRALGEYEEAIADCTKAISVDPNYADAYDNRGAAYGALGQYEEAIADFTEAIRLNPTDAEVYGIRGAAYVGMGEYDEAIEDCDKAIQLDSNLDMAYAVRGLAHYELGQYEQAITDLESFLRLAPPDDSWRTEAQQYIDEIRKLQ